MIEKCFDEGTIQAFLDGELSHEMVENVTHHISICDSCAMSVANAEEEIDFAFSLLDNEFNNLVPTERLWTKINFTIKAEGKNRSIWQSILAFLSSPSAIGFASLVIVFGLVIGLYSLKNGRDNGSAQNTINTKSTSPIVNTVESGSSPVKDQATSTVLPVVNDSRPGDFDSDHEFTARKAYLVKPQQTRRTPGARTGSNSPDAANPLNSLVSEESYVRTISTLEKTVNSQKDEVMQPAARFAFERNIAFADDTIKKMKVEVQRNPNNEAARVLLRNSYQNKIDLLNSLSEKSELMASLN